MASRCRAQASSSRICAGVCGRATASGNTPKLPERMASQSGRLWPRAWRTRASAWRVISGCSGRRDGGTWASTSARLASASGRLGPRRSARKAAPCSGRCTSVPSSPQPFQRRMPCPLVGPACRLPILASRAWRSLSDPATRIRQSSQKHASHADTRLYGGSRPAQVPEPCPDPRPGLRGGAAGRRAERRVPGRQRPAGAQRTARAPARTPAAAIRRSAVRPACGAPRAARLVERARLHHHELRHPRRGDGAHPALRAAGRRHGHQSHRAAGWPGAPELALPASAPAGAPTPDRERAGVLAALRALDRRRGAFPQLRTVRACAAGGLPGRGLRAGVRLSGAVRAGAQRTAGPTGVSASAAAPGRCRPAARPGGARHGAARPPGGRPAAAAAGPRGAARDARRRPAAQGTGRRAVPHDPAHPAAPPAGGRHQLPGDPRPAAPRTG